MAAKFWCKKCNNYDHWANEACDIQETTVDDKMTTSNLPLPGDPVPGTSSTPVEIMEPRDINQIGPVCVICGDKALKDHLAAQKSKQKDYMKTYRNRDKP